MKKNNKSVLAVTIITAIVAIGYVSCNLYQNQQLTYANPLMEENIEALAENNTKCMLTRDNCSFTITTQFQIDFLKKYFSNAGFYVTVDLTRYTSIYALNDGHHPVVNCGVDCNCNCLISKLL